MDARVNEIVQLALSQRGTAGSLPDVVTSPASQRRSSCASTAAPDVQADQHPQIEPTAVDDQRYLVDDITMPTTCELHVRAKNISIHVAYGSALPLNPCTTIHGRPIPPGYTSVTVEQIIGNNKDLELDFVRGDGDKTLGDALHGVVLYMAQGRHQTYCKHNGSRADRSPVFAAYLTAVQTYIYVYILSISAVIIGFYSYFP